MKILIIAGVLLLLDAASEIITYKRFCQNRPKWLIFAYIAKAIGIPAALITATIAYISTPTATAMAIMTWCVWLFVMNVAVKSIFAIAAAVDFITKRQHKSTAITALAIASLVALVMIYGAIVGRNYLRVQYVEINSPQIPQAFDGYKIVQFSDTHIGNLMATNLLENMVAKINELDADLVVQSGDLVNIHYKELSPSIVDVLKGIKAKNGVVAVLGNHDLGFYLADTTYISPRQTFDSLRFIQKSVLGWILLENDNFSIKRGCDSIVVAGVTYPKNMNHNNFNARYGGSDLAGSMRGVSDSTFSILVSHTPQMFDSIPSVARPNLTLSGHVHSMQTKVVMDDWKWSPAKWMYNMWSGEYKNGEYTLYVNDGIGYVLLPMRLGARPEITVFILKHISQTSNY